jgi:subtilisin family serine protease
MNLRLRLLILFTLLLGYASGQAKLNLSLMRKLADDKLGNEPISVFILGDPSVIQEAVTQGGGTVKFFAGRIASCKIPLKKIKDLALLPGILQIEDNDLKLQPLNDQLVINNHVQEIHLGFNLPQAYQGENVVMGIIDEGIDFTHPDFRDDYGRTRIKFLWDQSINNNDTATQARPYGYGKEFIGNQIDTSTEHSDGRYSHGSHVAGIACGNGLALNNYKGVAPKSDIIVVKMNLDQSDNGFLSNLVDAIKYIFDRADELGEPAVINASVGTYFGSHDGKDIQAQAIDYLITEKPGRSLVAAGGNAGSAPIHLGYEVTADTAMTWLQPTGGPVYIQAWGDSGSFENIRFSIAGERVQPGFKTLGRTPFSSVINQQGIFRSDTVFSGTNRIGIVQSGVSFLNNSWLYEFYIIPDSITSINGQDTSRYYWKLQTTGQGHLDAWSFNMVFDNLPNATIYPAIINYKSPDLTQNIVSSFTCSDKVITVGSSVNRNYYTNANYTITRDTALVPGSRSTFSSCGPTRDGRIKPDITATGEWVLSCGTQADLNVLTAVDPLKVAAGRKHKRSSGTSMSAPVVAGIAALYFQRYPQATWSDVKQAILNCADRDGFTGSNLPDNQWGYGKVNGYSVVKGCTVGIEELNGVSLIDFSIYPNPTADEATFAYDFSLLPSSSTIRYCLSDMTGRLITSKILYARTGVESCDILKLSPGSYVVSLEVDGRIIKTKKLIRF